MIRSASTGKVPVRGPATITPGMRMRFVRDGEVAEGVYTVLAINGLELTFAEPLPAGIHEDDQLVPCMD